jgi:hypothetical protein
MLDQKCVALEVFCILKLAFPKRPTQVLGLHSVRARTISRNTIDGFKIRIFAPAPIAARLEIMHLVNAAGDIIQAYLIKTRRVSRTKFRLKACGCGTSVERKPAPCGSG